MKNQLYMITLIAFSATGSLYCSAATEVASSHGGTGGDADAGAAPVACGNGLIDRGEPCDGLDLGGLSCLDLGFTGGTLKCSAHCSFDTSACERCGDGVIQGAELCDGQDLGGHTCADFGFTGGKLSCIACAALNTSACTTCGNGILEAGEECDDGGLVNGDGCSSTCKFENGCKANGSGCCSGMRAGFTDMMQFPDIAACAGAWNGHVSNASVLCEPGWHVCSPPVNPTDKAIVGAITLGQVTGFSGCFAYNAAHDNFSCIPCTGLVNEDDLAGMGAGCAYNWPGNNSCTATGRIDADCCDGALKCSYSPTLAGAVCCRDADGPPPPP